MQDLFIETAQRTVDTIYIHMSSGTYSMDGTWLGPAQTGGGTTNIFTLASTVGDPYAIQRDRGF